MRVLLLAALIVPAASSLASSEEAPVVRDGSTIERAVIVRQPTGRSAIDWEWQWIKEHYPSASWPGWMHQCLCEEHRLYDLYIFDTPAGNRKAYFDIGEKCD
jgi:hypothetical protein